VHALRASCEGHARGLRPSESMRKIRPGSGALIARVRRLRAGSRADGSRHCLRQVSAVCSCMILMEFASNRMA
jgi:hypothetical protein